MNRKSEQFGKTVSLGGGYMMNGGIARGFSHYISGGWCAQREGLFAEQPNQNFYNFQPFNL